MEVPRTVVQKTAEEAYAKKIDFQTTEVKPTEIEYEEKDDVVDMTKEITAFADTANEKLERDLSKDDW